MRSVTKFLVLSLLTFLVSNCIVYKTVDVPVSDETFHRFVTEGKQWTIQHAQDSARYVKIDEVHPDGFVANPGDVQRKRDHPSGPGRKTYWRAMGSYSMKIVHMELQDGIPIAPNMKLSYADVKTVTAHKGSALTVPLSAVTVGFYWCLLYLINPL